MPLRFQTTDPRGMAVICTDEAWQHIVSRRHWIKLDEIKAAIEKPLSIYTDSNNNQKQIYYAESIRSTEYIKVVVQFRGLSTLQVVTAYHTPQVKPGEKQIWPR